MTPFSLTRFFSTYVHTTTSFEALCHDNVPAGDAYNDAIQTHIADVANQQAKHDPIVQSGNIGILSIPRGGVPTAEGLSHKFTSLAKGKSTVELAHSRIKFSNDLFPDKFFDDKKTVIIADGVIATGGTIVKHLEQIPASYEGNVYVFANATAQMGRQAISDSAASLQRRVKLVTGRIFTQNECEWFEFPDKKVYFVGYNTANKLDYKLPDFGDHIKAPTL